MKAGKYNVWDKDTGEWWGIVTKEEADSHNSMYVYEFIAEDDYPKCPEADGWFIVQGSNRVPIVRRRIAGKWCYTSGELAGVTPDCYTILREIDPL